MLCKGVHSTGERLMESFDLLRGGGSVKIRRNYLAKEGYGGGGERGTGEF